MFNTIQISTRYPSHVTRNLQVIVAKSLGPKKLMSVTTKVVMQMNAKLGGELWSINIPMKKVMYVGIDTYHDSGSNKSVGGFVASMNDMCTR